MIYQIRYQHRSSETAEHQTSARNKALNELVRTLGSARAASMAVEVAADDGVYIYANQNDADRDDTGERAFAVISPDET